jgi:hypothetical protein
MALFIGFVISGRIASSLASAIAAVAGRDAQIWPLEVACWPRNFTAKPAMLTIYTHRTSRSSSGTLNFRLVQPAINTEQRPPPNCSRAARELHISRPFLPGPLPQLGGHFHQGEQQHKEEFRPGE